MTSGALTTAPRSPALCLELEQETSARKECLASRRLMTGNIVLLMPGSNFPLNCCSWSLDARWPLGFCAIDYDAVTIGHDLPDRIDFASSARSTLKRYWARLAFTMRTVCSFKECFFGHPIPTTIPR